MRISKTAVSAAIGALVAMLVVGAIALGFLFRGGDAPGADASADRSSEARAVAAQACQTVREMNTSDSAKRAASILSGNPFADTSTMKADIQQLSKDLASAKELAADAGEMDAHWLDLAHELSAIQLGPSSRDALAQAWTWCSAESLLK